MKFRRRQLLPLVAVLALSAAMTARNPLLTPDTTPIEPQIPGANRHQAGRLFLEAADSLVVTPDRPEVQILVGNVTFRQGDMYMYCDSALFYTSASLPTDSMEAYGNIRMEQGDTLFLYGDYMDYSGSRQLATVYGEGEREVRLINRDVTLTAPILHYSQLYDLGYYANGGKLTDPNNELTSLEGEYAPSTKEANFYTRVRLRGVSNKGDSVWVHTDTLLYNTTSRIAELPVYSRILGSDGDITTTSGFFNSLENTAILLNRSIVHTNRGNTITGDSLIYDRARGRGEAFGNMVLTDSARLMTLEGDYGFYNERTDSAYCTGRARALEYSNGTDTLYLHGEVIRTFQTPDSVRLMIANPSVRFWRSDIQGVCDSMTFVDTDSTLRMDRDPVVWNMNRQIFGNRILLHMNDSTVERAVLPDFGFMAEQIEGNYFNQLSGKEMIAYFSSGELSQLDVNGSVQAIMLPQENDSTYNKIANIESSFMVATFKGREIERVKLWDETSGTVTPLYLAKRSLLRLPKFQWFDGIRPLGPEDIYPRSAAAAEESHSSTPTAEEPIALPSEVVERVENVSQGSD